MSDQQLEDVPFGPVAEARLNDLRHVGSLTQVDANAHDSDGVTFLATSHGASNGKDHIDLTALADKDGIILSIKYRTLGRGWDLLAYDILAELCVGKQSDLYSQLSGADVIAWLKEQGEAVDAIPMELEQRTFPVLTKLATVASGAQDKASATETPKADKTASQLDWDDVGLFEKVRRVEEVLDEQVRPMLASDGGGIELVDLRDTDLVVHYSGACGSCSSSVGGTMIFIEDTLNNALGVELHLVVQNMDEPEPFVDL